jgi:transposase-like protein
MPAGRPPKGPKLVDTLDADPDVKTKLRLILETISGQRTVEDAAATLGVSPAYFHELRTRALEGAAQSLEPQPIGRPAQATADDTATTRELENRLKHMEVELEAARIREELALVMPHVLTSQKKTLLDKVSFSRRKRKR